MKELRAALVALALLTIITGAIYPAVVTGIAQAAFPKQANGSLIEKNGKIVGSKLIGQPFDDPKYFWGRLSATLDANGKPLPYNGGASGGSNLGPTNPALEGNARARIDALKAADPDNTAPIPVDLVTASGSGLDPHISPAAAEYQTRRIAKARGIGEARVLALIREHTEGASLGIIGEPRVNVLELNLALDELH